MTPPTPPYSHELHHALLTVQRACLLTQRVAPHASAGTLDKADHSPVTVGDFGAQALILHSLRSAFPSDAVVAEEEASALRSNASLRNQVWEMVRETKLSDEVAEKELGGAVQSEEDMLAVIDRGAGGGGREGRFWVLDPIDGTKGFLRGGQYAVCLALVVGGEVEVGVLGCPNLAVDDRERLRGGAEGEGGRKGVMFSAVRGQRATGRGLGQGGLEVGKGIGMREGVEVEEAVFCESVEAGHSNLGVQGEIARQLGIKGESVRMDSQAKYGFVARGAGDLYLRLPVKKGYQEKIWDHAAGDLIVREAGGVVTDVEGKRLDFGLGRTLSGNKGFVVAPRGIHGKVLEVVQRVLREEGDQTT